MQNPENKSIMLALNERPEDSLAQLSPSVVVAYKENAHIARHSFACHDCANISQQSVNFPSGLLLSPERGRSLVTPDMRSMISFAALYVPTMTLRKISARRLLQARFDFTIGDLPCQTVHKSPYCLVHFSNVCQVYGFGM